eukprot:6208418-Pleurochrysis_carterae.AAC.1
MAGPLFISSCMGRLELSPLELTLNKISSEHVRAPARKYHNLVLIFMGAVVLFMRSGLRFVRCKTADDERPSTSHSGRKRVPAT